MCSKEYCPAIVCAKTALQQETVTSTYITTLVAIDVHTTNDTFQKLLCIVKVSIQTSVHLYKSYTVFGILLPPLGLMTYLKLHHL